MDFGEPNFGAVVGDSKPACEINDEPSVSDPDLAARYDAAAPRWHRWQRWLGYPEAYARLFGRLQEAGWLRRLAGGGRVLDCGIGTGVLSLALARVCPPEEVVGVDIAPAMLREAAANFEGAGFEADLRRADAQRLQQPDASFDAVISAHMLEHLKRPEQAINEMARVLRSGASLILIATRGNLADEMIRLKWHHVPMDGKQLVTWMCRAGLENVAAYEIANALSPPRWLSRAFVGRRTRLGAKGARGHSACRILRAQSDTGDQIRRCK